MSESPSRPSDTAGTAVDLPADPFDAIERALRVHGADAAITQLIEHLDASADYRDLLDALLLKARHELGLPLIQLGTFSNLSEPARSRFEERYVEAIRHVGSRLLAAGQVPAAWAYFRAIGEPEPVTAALEHYQAGDDAQALGQVIDIAFQQGANPRRGFELILEHYGTCSAITALEQAPPADPGVQVACIERLVRNLHSQLMVNLCADVSRRQDPASGEARTITALISDRPWLFTDEAYHVDVSHLSAAVRYSILVSDPEVLALAVDLTEYGRRLSPRLQFEGAPPFERTFDDHRLFLRALLGHDPEAAIHHLEGQLSPDPLPDFDASLPAQVLVNLLARIGRHEAAIEVASQHLAHLPEQALSCPGLAELCQRAGRLDLLSSLARKQGRLVPFLAARIQNPFPE